MNCPDRGLENPPVRDACAFREEPTAIKFALGPLALDPLLGWRWAARL